MHLNHVIELSPVTSHLQITCIHYVLSLASNNWNRIDITSCPQNVLVHIKETYPYSDHLDVVQKFTLYNFLLYANLR